MQLLTITLSLWVLASQAGGRAPSDALRTAKSLYAAAEYEEALQALASRDAHGEGGEVEKYRALCLLALGRTAEVERVLEALVVHDPSYRLSDGDVTPRLVALFQATRRRLLPGIVTDAYAQARASFDSGTYAEASNRLRALLGLLADDDAAPDDATVRQDLRRVAEHFLELSEAARAGAATDTARSVSGGHNGGSSAPPDSRSDVTLIGAVVDRYVRAYETLDAEGVVQVFQGENPNPLRAAFGALKAQRVQAKNMKIAVDADGRSATVRLTWVVETVPKAGSPRKTQMPATLRMLKAATGDWFIVGRR